MRIPVTHIVQAGSGATASTDATVQIVHQATGAQANVYTASTGGSPITQPITPDSHGRLVDGGNDLWLDRPGRYEIHEFWGNNVRVIPWNAVRAPRQVTGQFTALTMANSWVAYGAPFRTPSYLLLGDGTLILSGLMKNGTTNAKCADLPYTINSGWEMFSVYGNGGIGTASAMLQVIQDELWVYNAGTAYVSLDTVQFQIAEL